MYHIFFIHSSVSGHLGCIHVLASMNSCEHRDMCIFLNYCFVWLCAQEWDCWIIWQLFLVFLRNLHTVFHSGCTNLHPHQQCEREGFPFLYTLYSICYLQTLVMAILTGVKWHLILALIIISLIES